ncbi:MAG: hypothetical protein RL518_616 [Pseudomonadota bacterium]|jgi:hypothetical protein
MCSLGSERRGFASNYTLGGEERYEGKAENRMTTHKEERTELHSALKEFAASPRFHFLKSIQVGPLLGDDASSLGPLAEMTFEQLMMAADERSSELNTLDDAQERLLVAVLHALAEGDVTESVEAGFDIADESDAQTHGGSTETTFNSVQCELELRDRVARLKAHPALETVARLTLGTFWEQDTPRAPFEESLTIGQFLALDLGVLAKKRSMTSARMRALAGALAGAARRLEVGEEKPRAYLSPLSEAVTPSQPLPRVRDGSVRHRWHGYSAECSPLEMALVESVMSASSDDEGDAATIFGALHHFCSVFSVSDFLRVMSGSALAMPTQRKLTAWANSHALREIVPLIRLVLRGPGTHISHIARILQGHNAPRAVFAIAATLIVRGLGAHQVLVQGAVCADVWTSNPGLLESMVRRVATDKKQPTSSLFAALCPDLDPFLHSWLQGTVFLPKGGKKRRKGRSRKA